MMNKKGQGAMEYLMTYGWAILVVIIVGVVLWQMGVFNPGASTAASFSGFGAVKPVEWLCAPGAGATDTVTVVLTNGAGGQITSANITVGAADAVCAPTTVAKGETSTCTIANVDCDAEASGDRFEVDVSLGYVSPTGARRSSSGTIWGPAD